MERADIILERNYKWKLIEFLENNSIRYESWFTETASRCVVSAILDEKKLNIIKQFLYHTKCSARIILPDDIIRIVYVE